MMKNYTNFCFTRVLVFCFAVCVFGSVSAQSLYPGDIAFVGFNIIGGQRFAFVATTDIPAGSVIYFTDNHFSAITDGLDNTEGTLTFTAGASGVAAGTVVTISGTTNFSTPTVSPIGAGTCSGASTFALDVNGDQILAYTGNSSSPYFIAAISNNGGLNGYITLGIPTANTSYLPSPLAVGSTAVYFSITNIDNGRYNVASITNFKSAILASVNNVANWTASSLSVVFSWSITSNRYYAKPAATGTGTGTSWANAMTLANAVKNAGFCDEIWVAAGTHYPAFDAFGNASPADNRDKTFRVASDVRVYGGFSGVETLLSARNITANQPLLSGDLGTVGNNSDNAYHVLLGVSQSVYTVINGVTVVSGNANGSGNITVNLLGFSRQIGGGALLMSSTPDISQCIFSGNATSGNGGGLALGSGSTPIVSRCVFTGNTAGGFGGGVWHNANGGASFNSCVFSANSAALGGGVYHNSTGVFYYNCTFQGNNAATAGGGIYNFGATSNLQNCIVWGNTGGGTTSIANGVGGNISATYTICQGVALAGTGNATTDPQFVNVSDPNGSDNIWMTTDDGLRITSCSPAINATVTSSGTDILGNAAIGNRDMGAYEYNGAALSASIAISGGTVCQNSPTLPSIKITGNGGISTLHTFSYTINGGATQTVNAGAGSNSAIFSAATATVGTFVYTLTSITEGSSSCATAITGQTGNVVIQALPTAAITTGSATICAGNTVAIPLTISATGNWTLTLSNGQIFNNTGSMAYAQTITPTSSTVYTLASLVDANCTANGGGLTGSYAVTVNPTPEAIITSSDADMCAGSSATISGSVIALGAWTLTLNSGNTATGTGNASFSIPVTPSAITTYTIATLSDANCAALSADLKGGMTVTPRALPTASITTPDASICAGASANISGSVSAQGSWQLILSDGSIQNGIGSSFSITVTPPTTTIYDIVQLTDLYCSTSLVGLTGYTTLTVGSQMFRAYVDGGVGSSGSGTSWAAPFKTVQEGLDAICGTGEVWVKSGTYLPTKDPFGNIAPANPRDRTFYLTGGKQIYGGFNGTETQVVNRPSPLLPTIFSGNIGAVNLTTDNAFHVLIVTGGTNTALIDGVILSNARASTPGFLTIGGNLIYRDNGGAVANAAGNITLQNCIFDQNYAGYAGGLYNYSGNVQLINCVFTQNTGAAAAGVIFNRGNILLQNCVLANNSTGGGASIGGGIMNQPPGKVTVSNSILWNNVASNAVTLGREEIYSTNTALNAVVVKNSLVRDAFPIVNVVNGGGNIAANPQFFQLSDPNGADNIWRTADDGLQLAACSPAVNAGLNTGAPALDILGVSISNGTKDMGAYERNTAAPVASLTGTTTICQLGITPPNLTFSVSGGIKPVTFSYTRNGGATQTASTTGSSNSVVVPASIALPGIFAYTLAQVSEGSSQCSAGSIAVPTATISVLRSRSYVDAAVALSGNGNTWATPFKTIQEGLDAVVCSPMEVWVRNGTYFPTKDAAGSSSPADTRDKTFYISSNKKLYGGFTGTENLLSDRPAPTPNATILSGDLGLAGDASDNAYHVVLMVNASINTLLDGVTVKDGNADNGGVFNVSGVDVSQAFGGGICTSGGKPTISNSFITANNASTGGGIANIGGGNAHYLNCTVVANTAGKFGGGIYNEADNSSWDNCVVHSNMSMGVGGGMYNSASPTIIQNSIFYNNSSDNAGGIYNSASSATLYNTTVAQNIAFGLGGGVSNADGSDAIITNGIIWGNTDGSGASNIYDDGSSPVVTYSTVEGGYTGTGNSSLNPQFYAPADPDGADNSWRTPDDGFRLKPCSPAIGAGDNAIVATATDFAAATRIQHTTVDMGAYENTPVGYLNLLNLPGNTLQANDECLTADGWTHYYEFETATATISLKKGNNTNIGNIGNGSFFVQIMMPNNPSAAENLSQAPYITPGNAWYVMNRTWQVAPTNQPLDSVGVRFYYRAADFNEVNTAAGSVMSSDTELRFYKLLGSNPFPWSVHLGLPPASMQFYTYGTTPNQSTWKYAQTPGGNRYAEYFVSSFSGGGGGSSPAAILPVGSLYLTVAETAPARLQWNGSEGKAATHFEMLQSTDGYVFQPIAEQTADASNSYAFSPSALGQTAWYRVAEHHTDGSVSYSNIVEIAAAKTPFSSLLVYPNPCSEQLFLHITGEIPEGSRLSITDMLGHEVLQYALPAHAQDYSLDIAHLPAGMYAYRLLADGELLGSGRLMKE